MKSTLIYPKLFFILISLSIALFLLDSLGLLYFPKLIAQAVTVPIQYGFFQFGKSIGAQFQFLVDARFSALENKALKLQLSQVISENATLQKKLRENQELIDQSNKLNPQIFNLVPARVIGFGRTMTIDKGANDGVKIGQVVVYQDNYVGIIRKVNPKTSEVLLPFDPDSKVAVFSQNKDGRAKGILLGQFGSELLMDKILHQEQVAVGDLVYSEGSEGVLPRGLILGTVDKVMENQNEVFKQAQVKPIFDFNNLDLVFIIRE